MRALINIAVPLNGEGKHLTPSEFRKLLYDLGLQPFEHPHITDEDTPEQLDHLREYYLERAKPIFDKMPENSEEEKTRKLRSAQNIIYASELAISNTLFMVTAQTNGIFRFRLLNPRVEKLQEACEQFIMICRTNKLHKIDVIGEIEILETGLEVSTIIGTVVEGRFRGIGKLAYRDFLLVGIGLVGFIITSLISGSNLIQDPWLRGQIDRFSTGMLTTTLVSAVSIYYLASRLSSIVKWTAGYERQGE